MFPKKPERAGGVLSSCLLLQPCSRPHLRLIAFLGHFQLVHVAIPFLYKAERVSAVILHSQLSVASKCLLLLPSLAPPRLDLHPLLPHQACMFLCTNEVRALLDLPLLDRLHRLRREHQLVRSLSGKKNHMLISYPAARPLTYSRETLLSLASSPLARLAPETRDSIRNALPELIMNRKMRKAIEYHATQLEHQKRQQQQQERAAQPTKFTRSPVPAARRSRPIGRAPERRRNALEKLVDDQSWRAMRMPASPILI